MRINRAFGLIIVLVTLKIMFAAPYTSFSRLATTTFDTASDVVSVAGNQVALLQR